MGSRIRKLLWAAFFAASALEALYVLPANVVLNTRLAGRLIERRPEKFRIRWTLAITPWPGFVRLWGVETGGQSRAIQWEARLASVSTTFRMRPLRDRVVELGTVRAEAIEYAQRPRLDPGAEPPPEAGDWPVFAGVANPPTGPGAGIGPPPPPRPPWRVRAERIRGTVRQIWIGRYRMAGTADLDASLDLVTRGPITLPRIDYRLEKGDLFVGAERMFADLRLLVEARLEPFTPRGRAAVDVIRSLTGRFDLDAKDGTLKFLEVYFRKAEGLRIDGGGPMRLLMLLDRGRLLQGSHIERHDDRVDTTFLDSRVTGTGAMRADVRIIDGVPTSWVEMRMDQYQVSQVGHTDPHAHGRGFRVVVTSTALELADPFEDVHLAVDLHEATIPDLGFYNRYLPANSRMAILSGVGRLRYHFEGDSNARSLHGTMTFAMRDLALKFEETTLVGDLTIDTRLRAGDPRERRFDIGGTTITMHHHAPRWDGTIALPEASLTFAEPMQVRARVALDLQDTTPLVRVFDAYKDLSRTVERLMTIEEVRGGARLTVDGSGTDIRDLAITGAGLKALAELSLGDAGREGLLYIRFHGIALGIELERGRKKDLKLFRPLAWYEKARAARRAAHAPRSAPVQTSR